MRDPSIIPNCLKLYGEYLVSKVNYLGSVHLKIQTFEFMEHPNSVYIYTHIH